jgi:hypothetical protein
MEMFTRKGLFASAGRAAIVATVAALALTTVEPSVAMAASAAPVAKSGLSVNHGISGNTDISAARRRSRGRRGGGGGAAIAAFAGIVGTGLAIAAAQNRRDDYYYDGGPGYYGAPYGGYGYRRGPVHYRGGYGYRHSSVPHFRGHPQAGW